MRIKVITKKQALADARLARARTEDLNRFVDRGVFLGRCLKALRLARHALEVPGFDESTSKWDDHREILKEIDDILLNL